MSKFIKYIFPVTVLGLVLVGVSASAQSSQLNTATTLNAQVGTSSPIIITGLSASSTVPGQWIVITGEGLGRNDVYVDSVKVPLSNILYTDALGRNIRYRVQSLLSGSHTLNIVDAEGNLSNPVIFTITNNNQAEFSDVQRIFDIKVSTLNPEQTWSVGQTNTITWSSEKVVGTVDIYLCNPVAKKCLVLASNTLNDGNETFRLPLKTLAGDSYILVRSHHNTKLMDRSLPFFVTITQTSNPFKNFALVIGSFLGL